MRPPRRVLLERAEQLVHRHGHRADRYQAGEGEGHALLAAGGLEYLFGASWLDPKTGALEFSDWWGHDRDGEKLAYEGFVDWVFARWNASPSVTQAGRRRGLSLTTPGTRPRGPTGWRRRGRRVWALLADRVEQES